MALWHTAGLLMRYGLHARDAAHEGTVRQSRDRTPRTREGSQYARYGQDMCPIWSHMGHISGVWSIAYLLIWEALFGLWQN